VKVVIFGATGMVGQGVLPECLLEPFRSLGLDLRQPEYRRLSSATDAIMLPEPNHGRCASISSCLRFASRDIACAEWSNVRASNISCSCSMSSMIRSTSIPSQYPT
jgi:hypothetical protein